MPHTVDLKNQNIQPTKTESLSSSVKLEWQAYEFEKREKDKNWFNILIILTALFFVVAIVLKNYTFSIVVLSAALCVYIYAKKNPRLIDFSISPRGVSMGNKPYPYSDLKSFWIFYDPPRIKELVIVSKKKIQPLIHIPINGQSPIEIRNFLLKYLREEEQEESIIDIFSDLIKF